MFYQVINEPKRIQSKYWIDNRQIYKQDPAFYEAEITDAMKKILDPVKKQFQAKDTDIRPSGYYVSRNTSLQEIEEMEELDRIAAQDEPERLCWSVPIPGCEALRFIEIFFCKEDGEFCVSVNSQVSSHSVGAIQACEVPGKPEIVAKIGRVGLTAERRDTLLNMAGIEVEEPNAEDNGSSSAEEKVIDFGVCQGMRLSECRDEYLKWAAAHKDVHGADHKWVSIEAKKILDFAKRSRKARKQHKKWMKSAGGVELPKAMIMP